MGFFPSFSLRSLSSQVFNLIKSNLLIFIFYGYQAPPSMGFSRQEYWSGVPLPSPEPTAILISEDISLCQVEDDILSWKIKFCLWIYFLRSGSSLSSYLLKRRLEYRKTELGGKHRRERRITEHQCVKAMAPPLQYSCLENPMDGGAW